MAVEIASMPDDFAPGVIVTINGLKSRPALNGCLATIAGPRDETTGRWPVRPEDSKQCILLKTDNIFSWPQDPTFTPASATMLQSSPCESSSIAVPPSEGDKPARQELGSAQDASEPGGDDKMLPALPNSPMWTPPEVGVASSQLAWRRRREKAVVVDDDEDEDDEAWDQDAEEADAIDELAIDAALLRAARLGADSLGATQCFLPTRACTWRDENTAILKPSAPACRWNPTLAGGSVLCCDVSTSDGVAAARDAIERRVPIVMRGGAASELLGQGLTTSLASLEGVRSHLEGREVTVLQSAPDTASRFTYYFDEKAYNWNFAAPPPINRRLTLRWDSALEARLQMPGTRACSHDTECRRATDGSCGDADVRSGTCYMQLGVAARRGGAYNATSDDAATAKMGTAASPELLNRLRERMTDGGLMASLVPALGPWTTSMLYVGPAGTLAPCHWDALDNIFVQTCGVKHVLLFAPDTPGMRAFPSDHPFDSRSQLDLEAIGVSSEVDHELLRHCGGVACLQPGDALFIPNHWWHHIHSDDSNQISISINFWFSPFEELAVKVIPQPMLPHMHPQLARAAEALVVSHASQREHISETLASMLAFLDGRTLDTDGCMQKTLTGRKAHILLGVRNFVLKELVAIYGRQGAAHFCRVFLDPQRWRGLRRQCFRNSA